MAITITVWTDAISFEAAHVEGPAQEEPVVDEHLAILFQWTNNPPSKCQLQHLQIEEAITLVVKLEPNIPNDVVFDVETSVFWYLTVVL